MPYPPPYGPYGESLEENSFRMGLDGDVDDAPHNSSPLLSQPPQRKQWCAGGVGVGVGEDRLDLGGAAGLGRPLRDWSPNALATSQSQESHLEELRRREEGFMTALNGANAQSVDERRKREATAAAAAAAAGIRPPRRNWVDASATTAAAGYAAALSTYRREQAEIVTPPNVDSLTQHAAVAAEAPDEGFVDYGDETFDDIEEDDELDNVEPDSPYKQQQQQQRSVYFQHQEDVDDDEVVEDPVDELEEESTAPLEDEAPPARMSSRPLSATRVKAENASLKSAAKDVAEISRVVQALKEENRQASARHRIQPATTANEIPSATPASAAPAADDIAIMRRMRALDGARRAELMRALEALEQGISLGDEAAAEARAAREATSSAGVDKCFQAEVPTKSSAAQTDDIQGAALPASTSPPQAPLTPETCETAVQTDRMDEGAKASTTAAVNASPASALKKKSAKIADSDGAAARPLWFADAKSEEQEATGAEDTSTLRASASRMPSAGRRAGTPAGQRRAATSDEDEEKDASAAPIASEEPAPHPRRRQRGNSHLEASWDSLAFFSRTQAGRLQRGVGTSKDSDDLAPMLRGSLHDEDNLLASVGAELPLDLPDALDAFNEQPNSSGVLMASATTPELSAGNAEGQQPTADFIIPLEPAGHVLDLLLHTTWGDRHYIGLAGVQAFDRSGAEIPLQLLGASPSSVSELPGLEDDPRTPDKLIDGVFATSDDVHMWLAPFTRQQEHVVSFALAPETSPAVALGMLRIWNYNKSRIHSHRGVRHCSVLLDGLPIFQGELGRAPGSAVGCYQAAECILFTESEACLEAIAATDDSLLGDDAITAEDIERLQRPPTAEKEDEATKAASLRASMNRPFTAIGGAALGATAPVSSSSAAAFTSGTSSAAGVKGRLLRLEVLATWGDANYAGLSNISLLDASGTPVEILSATGAPHFEAMDGTSADPRTADKLLDGVLDDVSHTWLAPFEPGGGTFVELTLDPKREVHTLCVHNYNKNVDDASRGVRLVRVLLDGVALGPVDGVWVRKAPGVPWVSEFAQELVLTSLSSDAMQPSPSRGVGGVADLAPVAFSHVKIVVSRTWGDKHYVGLQGVELVDATTGEGFPLDPANVFASPWSVSDDDPRTPNKLADGVHSEDHVASSWLAPWTGKAEVCLLLPCISSGHRFSSLRIWNYVKTKRRGVREFRVLFDDAVVFVGTAKMASAEGCQEFVLFTGGNAGESQGLSDDDDDDDDDDAIALYNDDVRSTADGEMARPATAVK